MRFGQAIFFGTVAGLLTLAAPKRNLTHGLRHVDPTGKSLPIIGNDVKPRARKYTAQHRPQISGITAPVTTADEGRSRSSRMRGGMRWTPTARETVRAGSVR